MEENRKMKMLNIAGRKNLVSKCGSKQNWEMKGELKKVEQRE